MVKITEYRYQTKNVLHNVFVSVLCCLLLSLFIHILIIIAADNLNNNILQDIGASLHIF